MTNTHDVRTERAVVLSLLRDDHPERWTRAELEREASVGQAVFLGVLATLSVEGAVILDGEDVLASRCAKHLDRLGLVGV